LCVPLRNLEPRYSASGSPAHLTPNQALVLSSLVLHSSGWHQVITQIPRRKTYTHSSLTFLLMMLGVKVFCKREYHLLLAIHIHKIPFLYFILPSSFSAHLRGFCADCKELDWTKTPPQSCHSWSGAARWHSGLALLPHSARVRFPARVTVCVEFARSPRPVSAWVSSGCSGFLPQSQRRCWLGAKFSLSVTRIGVGVWRLGGFSQ